MDLSRLVVGHCPSAFAEPNVKQRFFTAIFQGASWFEPWVSPLPKPRETNVLLLLRALANAFQDTTTAGDGVWIKSVCKLIPFGRYITYKSL